MASDFKDYAIKEEERERMKQLISKSLSSSNEDLTEMVQTNPIAGLVIPVTPVPKPKRPLPIETMASNSKRRPDVERFPANDPLLKYDQFLLKPRTDVIVRSFDQ